MLTDYFTIDLRGDSQQDLLFQMGRIGLTFNRTSMVADCIIFLAVMHCDPDSVGTHLKDLCKAAQESDEIETIRVETLKRLVMVAPVGIVKITSDMLGNAPATSAQVLESTKTTVDEAYIKALNEMNSAISVLSSFNCVDNMFCSSLAEKMRTRINMVWLALRAGQCKLPYDTVTEAITQAMTVFHGYNRMLELATAKKKQAMESYLNASASAPTDTSSGSSETSETPKDTPAGPATDCKTTQCGAFV